MARSAVRSSARNSRRQAYPHQGSSTLPRLNRALYIPNRYPFTDRIGKHDGPAQLRQFAEVTSGTIALYHPSITGSETIASGGGDAPVSVVVGGIVIGVGKAWAIKDNAGHHWSHCAALSTTSAVMWDVSGLGDHLIAEGLSEEVVVALCSTSRDLTVGTDWLDKGFIVASSATKFYLYIGAPPRVEIPSGVIVPAGDDGMSCAYTDIIMVDSLIMHSELEMA